MKSYHILDCDKQQKIADSLNDAGKAIPSPRRDSIAVDSLQPTFRTDIANK